MYVHTIQWLSLDSFPHLLPLHILHFTSLSSFLLQFFEELYYLLDNFVPAQSMSIRGFRWDLLHATLLMIPVRCIVRQFLTIEWSSILKTELQQIAASVALERSETFAISRPSLTLVLSPDLPAPSQSDTALYKPDTAAIVPHLSL